MGDVVGVVGTGLLQDAVAEALGARAVAVSARTDATAADASEARALVCVSDEWDTSRHDPVRALAVQAGVPWLAAWTELGDAIVGPLEVPGDPGCLTCLWHRRERIRSDRHGWLAVRRQYGEVLATRPSSWLTSVSAELIGAFIATDIERLLLGGQPRSRGAMHRIRLDQLAITRHPFLPDPACEQCGGLPDDAPELAATPIRTCRAYEPGSYRARFLVEQLPSLVEWYVDAECGLIHSMRGWTAGGLVATEAPLGFANPRATGSGYGRASTFPESRLTALLEALERYGSSPGGRRTAVVSAYRDIEDYALDPRAVGLYPEDRYRLPGFKYQPFDPDRRYRWVWGHSLVTGRPLLVHERLVYYSAPTADDTDVAFVNEVSNGCALGSCMAEAALYGLLEVAERDAFLLTWYARLAPPRIDIDSIADQRIPLLAAAIEAESGHQVIAFDISVEQQIPSVLALALNPAADGWPAAVCAAAAHPDPLLAGRNALRELGPSVVGLMHQVEDLAEARRASAMVNDSTLVTAMPDHPLVYAEPRAAARLQFVTTSAQVRRLDEVGGTDLGGFASDDLRENLREAVSRYADCGMDVIVVDQTTAEHRVGGFRCVKVLVPGTLPMTFGHQLRRTTGLPRLHHVPVQLGYRRQPLRTDEINPYPHPFP